MRKVLLTAVAAILTLGVTGLIADRVEARPSYLGVFMETYPALKQQAGAAKCGVCHPQQNKKIRNDYGMAVQQGLGGINVKPVNVIQNALQGAEILPSPNGMTFGEIIKGGKLPN